MSVQYDSGYQTYKNLKVFLYRVGVHTLGQQTIGEGSENHVTLALVIGKGASVRIDMSPSDDYGQGLLSVRLQNFTLSTSIIKFADIRALHCPDNFDERKDFDASSSGYTVENVVQLLLSFGLDTFRFQYIEESSIGCRYWMLRTLNTLFSAGHFAHPDALNQGNPSTISILGHKWDRTLQPRSMAIVPGIFKRSTEAFTEQLLVERLPIAHVVPLKDLATALTNSRSADRRLLLIDEVEEAHKQPLITAVVRYLTPRDLVTASDLMQSKEVWGDLAQSLYGRYSLAMNCLLQAYSWLENDPRHYWSAVAFLLAGIVDMSGAPDGA